MNKKKIFLFFLNLKYDCDNTTPERKTMFCFVFFLINEQINESKWKKRIYRNYFSPTYLSSVLICVFNEKTETFTGFVKHLLVVLCSDVLLWTNCGGCALLGLLHSQHLVALQLYYTLSGPACSLQLAVRGLILLKQGLVWLRIEDFIRLQLVWWCKLWRRLLKRFEQQINNNYN